MDYFIFENDDECISKIFSWGVGWEIFFCFFVKEVVDWMKKGFVVFVSFWNKIWVVVYFWFENGVLNNSGLICIGLIVWFKFEVLLVFFKFVVDWFLFFDFFVVLRSIRM